LRSIGGQHNVAEKGDLGMTPGWPIDCADDRYFDVKELHQQMATLPLNAVNPLDRRTDREGRGAGGRPWPRELIPRAGDDHHAVLVVRPNVVERFGQLTVRKETPTQWAAICMQRHLQNSMAPLHADRLVFGRVLVELAHRRLLVAGLVYHGGCTDWSAPAS